MRIAYLSYEHPKGISGGGIGTYIGQMAKIMAEAGHSVEVFSGIEEKVTYQAFKHDGYQLHLIPAEHTEIFREKVLKVFEAVHLAHPFDAMESPEYGADALEVKLKYPEIPLVVKLHTPTFLISKLNSDLNFLSKMRFVLGALRKGNRPKFFWSYNNEYDPEYVLTSLAEKVVSPSHSLAKIVSQKWNLETKVIVVPYPFKPNQQLLKTSEVSTKPFVVTFIGKLEKRKGVLGLMRAIPKILKKYPNVIFRFVGKALPSPKTGMDMQDYMLSKLSTFRKNLDFQGFQSYEKIPEYLETTSVCIFPSLWENFPNVCLETMAAGRVVVGTDNGGMADMIEDGKTGYLIKPSSSQAVARVILKLLESKPEELAMIGAQARDSVLKRYNANVIGDACTTIFKQIIHKVDSR
ncbi:hypothetical protein BCY91_12225 [Pelobium manganitolerans]|uniref:Glycosyl transferase family 1 n=1 Tax=Pelobium manganitolerans TaxID=1842495 RepID=A0A419S1Q5_9SPHI|nr:glycosyltransferase family 4 protein [Pelobium manganitolerans]RKD12410.1 hypothetical protein BCY91_12225 [Pelobium manganitolerans]